MGLVERVRRNVVFLVSAVRVLNRIKFNSPESPVTTADYVETWAAKRPDHVAIYFDDRRVTYKEWDEAAYKYARWALDRGVKRGDVVALMMENRPEFLIAWTGMAKIGAVTALINTRLRSQPLAHCIELAHPKHLILGGECIANYASAAEFLRKPLSVWVTGGSLEGARNLDVELSAQSGARLPEGIRRGLTAAATCFYIYTSGTTGMPKAARLTHYRVGNIMNGFAAATGARASDRIYIPMPLYHSAGGVAGVGTCLTVGGAVILKRQFSAGAFWKDCVRYQATIFQYIGELCRYLINAPPVPEERAHKIRVCVGNGLRVDIWETFRHRFMIPRILEFYGATEGNVLLFNFDGKPGAVGRVPRYLRRRYLFALVEFDVERQEPVRDPDGFCREVPTGEVGECLGAIYDRPRSRFEGYSNVDETERKILRDVFEKDDAWFRTGDLMRKDKHGYFYFVDRVGDTFRWKGENVSTSEVEHVISMFDGIKEANVYGVRIPNMEGRAGMASLVVEEGIDLKRLKTHIADALPEYARPLFLRLRQEIDTTSTLKHRKLDLVEHGFDPAVVVEPLYFANPEVGEYVPLDEDLFHQIRSGRFRF